MSLAASPCVPPLPRLRTLGAADLPLHVEAFAVLACTGGDLVARAAGESFRLRSGELLVLRRAGAVELEWADSGAQIALFLTSLAWVDAFWALHGADPDTTPRSGGIERVPAGAALARRAVQLLSAPPGSASPPTEQRLPASCVAALLEIAFQAEGSPLAACRSRAHLADQRRALVRALADYDPEADGDFSLHGLADRLGLSSRQTARLVRGETGRSFRELKAAARIERAQKLLASSELSILEVALRAGWNSASQFHEAFRQSVGVTPARFRAAQRG
jgi:AraC-like DNA-binding protein